MGNNIWKKKIRRKMKDSEARAKIDLNYQYISSIRQDLEYLKNSSHKHSIFRDKKNKYKSRGLSIDDIIYLLLDYLEVEIKSYDYDCYLEKKVKDEV